MVLSPYLPMTHRAVAVMSCFFRSLSTVCLYVRVRLPSFRLADGFHFTTCVGNCSLFILSTGPNHFHLRFSYHIYTFCRARYACWFFVFVNIMHRMLLSRLLQYAWIAGLFSFLSQWISPRNPNGENIVKKWIKLFTSDMTSWDILYRKGQGTPSRILQTNFSHSDQL